MAETAWSNFRSFPGHTETADDLYRQFITRKAALATTLPEIEAVTYRANRFEPGTELLDTLLAQYFDRATLRAARIEDRDAALVAALDALVEPSPQRRRRAAGLAGGDYADLIATLEVPRTGRRIFNTTSVTLSDIDGSRVSQWSLAGQELRGPEEWQITALEVTPLVRRIIVDQDGTVRRAALTLNIRHARHSDLRIKLIAPSGRTIEIETGRDRSSMVDDIRIPSAALAELAGETLAGTWSLSIRDEETGVAGHLVGWNLTLNAQGLIEDFQRGVDIPDPVAVEASNIWVSDDGRYAIARATQSDSARVWDLGFGKPIRAIALSQGESLIGLDSGARRLISASLDSVNLWDTASGDRVATLPIAGAGISGRLTGDRRHLFVSYPGDTKTRFELWSLDSGERVAGFDIAGTPALVTLDHAGERLAVADFDRSVRIWDFRDGKLVAQINLGAQPSDIGLSPQGAALGATYGQLGMSLWSVAGQVTQLFEILEPGAWRFAFAPSGDLVIAGTPSLGFTVFDSRTGAAHSAPLGLDSSPGTPLAFSNDESIIISGGPGEVVRFWRAPVREATMNARIAERPFWHPPPGVPVAASPDARKLLVGDREGHLHIFSRSADPTELAAAAKREVDYLGHSAPISSIDVDDNSVWAATAAVDGSLRVWGIADGLPQPWLAEGLGNISAVDFSPDGRRIAVLDSIAVRFIDRASGDDIYSFLHGGSVSSLVYAENDSVYAVSAEEGLLMIRPRPGAPAATRRVWQGTAPVSMITQIPDTNALIVVDAENTARVISMADGTVATDHLQLPGPVREVAVAPSGSRVLFRTDRWIHTVLVTPDGLLWRDARLVDATGAGNRIVFDSSPDDSGRRGAPLLIQSGSSGLSLEPLDAGDQAPGVFGSRDILLSEWTQRLGIGR